MTPNLVALETVRRVMFVAAVLCGLAPVARAQGVSLKVMPGTSTVTPGATFDMDLQVTPAGSPFNAFDLVVEYDPAALRFVQRSPLDLQRGCLMTGACSPACGNTFHLFNAARDSIAPDSLRISLSLLCNNIALTGPGQVYTLRFIASNTPQVTHLRIRSGQFYNAGLFVNPLTTTDAAIGIGIQLDAPPGGAASAWRLEARPNPARGRVALTVGAPEAGRRRIAVFDLSGRMVRLLEDAWRPPGRDELTWDGADSGGMRVPPGLYLVRMEIGGRVTRARVAVLD